MYQISDRTILECKKFDLQFCTDFLHQETGQWYDLIKNNVLKGPKKYDLIVSRYFSIYLAFFFVG